MVILIGSKVVCLLKAILRSLVLIMRHYFLLSAKITIVHLFFAMVAICH